MKEGKLYRLGEICDFQGGSQPPKQEWIKAPKEGYVRMLQIRDFTKSRDFVIEYVKCSNKLRYCNEDDILIGRYGASVGKILTGLSGAYNVAIIKTIPNEQVITKAYIRRFFEGKTFQDLLQKVCGQRTAQAGFSKEDIVDLPIFVPPLSEQQRIVSLLDAEFAKIDTLKANAERNLQNAKDLFQAALKKELEPKEGWKWSYLPSISENLDSKRIPITLKDRIAGVYPYYGASGIVDYVSEYLFDDDLLLISEDGANLLARSTPIAFSVSGKIWVNNHAHILKFKDMATQKIVEYYFASILIDEYITGAAQPKLTQANMNKIAIPIPPTITDQKAIVARLDALNEKCETLQANYEKTIALCDDLKQALLRKAFNGEI